MSTPRKNSVPASHPAPAQIGIEELKTLISLVSKEQIHEFEFESGSLRFRIRKEVAALAPTATPVAAAASPVLSPMPTQTVTASLSEASGEPADEPGVHYITSPIVGTFYRAPSPSAEPYVQVGDFVKPGQILCVVEAMKLMNEIEGDSAGEVVRVLVENGQPVEYGERLFAIRVG